MPSNLSFASAAAGQNPNRDGRNGSRTDSRGNTSGEWYVIFSCFHPLLPMLPGLPCRRPSYAYLHVNFY